MTARTLFSMLLAAGICVGFASRVSAAPRHSGCQAVLVVFDSPEAENDASDVSVYKFLHYHPRYIYIGIILSMLVFLVSGHRRRRADRKLIAKLQATNASRTRFLYNMSYDARTPMSAIVGFIDIAMENLDDQEVLADSLDKIRSSSEALLSTINGVMDMSRIESGNVKLNEKPGDVLLSFVNVEKQLRRFARSKGVNIDFSFGNILDRYVYADYSHCGLVFVNLISNAVKYTEAGGNVRVQCEQAGKTEDGRVLCRYTVSDSGVGMSEEQMAHIYEDFDREYDPTACSVQGAGLGLPLCKRLVDILGGTISCCSEVGKGSMFVVTLPFRVQDGTKEYIDPRSGDLIHAKEQAKKVDITGKRVLLVEDNELNREVSMFQLRAHGLLVETAENGQVAVDKVKKGDFDFVLMDIQMPVMDGYEATRRIREFNHDITIIAVSANAQEEDREKSIAVGMDDHITKPISEKGLFECMARCYASA